VRLVSCLLESERLYCHVASSRVIQSLRLSALLEQRFRGGCYLRQDRQALSTAVGSRARSRNREGYPIRTKVGHENYKGAPPKQCLGFRRESRACHSWQLLVRRSRGDCCPHAASALFDRHGLLAPITRSAWTRSERQNRTFHETALDEVGTHAPKAVTHLLLSAFAFVWAVATNVIRCADGTVRYLCVLRGD
jgi:hypothetical protein